MKTKWTYTQNELENAILTEKELKYLKKLGWKCLNPSSAGTDYRDDNGVFKYARFEKVGDLHLTLHNYRCCQGRNYELTHYDPMYSFEYLTMTYSSDLMSNKITEEPVTMAYTFKAHDFGQIVEILKYLKEESERKLELHEFELGPWEIKQDALGTQGFRTIVVCKSKEIAQTLMQEMKEGKHGSRYQNKELIIVPVPILTKIGVNRRELLNLESSDKSQSPSK